MCSNEFICFYDWAECRLIRRIDVNVKVGTDLHFVSIRLSSFYMANFFLRLYYYSFQNVYWADSGDLVAIASDSSFYILKYNVRILVMQL